MSHWHADRQRAWECASLVDNAVCEATNEVPWASKKLAMKARGIVEQPVAEGHPSISRDDSKPVAAADPVEGGLGKASGDSSTNPAPVDPEKCAWSQCQPYDDKYKFWWCKTHDAGDVYEVESPPERCLAGQVQRLTKALELGKKRELGTFKLDEGQLLWQEEGFCKDHVPPPEKLQRVVPEYECYVCNHIGTVKHLNRVKDQVKDHHDKGFCDECRNEPVLLKGAD